MSEKEWFAQQLREHRDPSELMREWESKVRGRTAPHQHHFRPDPLTPTACLICALGQDWHPEHQPADAGRLTLEEQARLVKLRGVVTPSKREESASVGAIDREILARAMRRFGLMEEPLPGCTIERFAQEIGRQYDYLAGAGPFLAAGPRSFRAAAALSGNPETESER